MSRVAVIGGGASGMMAAIAAAGQGHTVTIYEKNEKLGKKIYITGKGRCNFTNDCAPDELLQAVCVNRKFLYSAFYEFDAQQTIRFFEEEGMPVKTERGRRVFPASDHASDVTAALERRLKKEGVTVRLNQEVREILSDGDTDGRPGVTGIQLRSGEKAAADHVIVATGGLSYPSTGSTGDGYRLARKAGHTVTACCPSLVPIETEGTVAGQMQGLSLKNVEVSVLDKGKVLFREFGEMLFTHFGVTGPLILTASAVIGQKLQEHPLTLRIDCKPALTKEQLDARILRDFEGEKNRQFKNALSGLLPAKMIPVIVARSGILPEKPVHDITRKERQALVSLIKGFTLTLLRLRDYNEAVITRGGVSVKEINPSTMESRKMTGLSFAGEVLDVDALTGGYNLQIAWSTGHLAGACV